MSFISDVGGLVIFILFIVSFGCAASVREGIGIVLGIIIFIGGIVAMFSYDRQTYDDHSMGCSLCGYRWDERTINRSQPIQVQHDLIEKGEQRLGEERRRRMRD